MTRYEKFMRLPRGLRIVIATILFIPSWVAAQPEIIIDLWREWRGLVCTTTNKSWPTKK